MTTTETWMSVISGILMMAFWVMFIIMLFGIVDADIARSPIQATGLCAVVLFITLRIKLWLRSKTKPV